MELKFWAGSAIRNPTTQSHLFSLIIFRSNAETLIFKIEKTFSLADSRSGPHGRYCQRRRTRRNVRTLSVQSSPFFHFFSFQGISKCMHSCLSFFSFFLSLFFSFWCGGVGFLRFFLLN